MSAREVTDPGKVDPRVFVSLGSHSLWAGGRPRLFRRLLKRGRLGPDFRTVSALVWTGWASLAPTSLRAFLRSLLFVRNAHAALLMKGNAPVRWHMSVPAEAGDPGPAFGPNRDTEGHRPRPAASGAASARGAGGGRPRPAVNAER